MGGTAGSKYGIVKDGLPAKDSLQIKPRKKLKSLSRLLKRKKKQNQASGGSNGGEP